MIYGAGRDNAEILVALSAAAGLALLGMPAAQASAGRVPFKVPGNSTLRAAFGVQDRQTGAGLLLHPPDRLPLPDAHLAQALHLVTDEDGFARTANRAGQRRLCVA